jgi:hypothetical protein
MSNTGQLVTVTEFANTCRSLGLPISPATAYRLTKRGQLESVKVGRSLRVSGPSALDFISRSWSMPAGLARAITETTND